MLGAVGWVAWARRRSETVEGFASHTPRKAIVSLVITAPLGTVVLTVHALRERLDSDPETQGVAVGTVDKFQGREAAVVFFSMATSAAANMPRSGDFLFSRNRLNVAISRARCLAYLVCTEELLDSRGRDVDEMRLISTLCAFAASAKSA